MAKYRITTSNGTYEVETADTPSAAPTLDDQTAALGGGPAPDINARARAGIVSHLPAAGLAGDDIPGPSMPVAGGMGLSAPVNYDTPVQGVRQIRDGAAQMTRGTLRDAAGGVHQILNGAMQVGQPLLPLSVAAAPVATVAGLAAGSLVGSGTTHTLKAMGVPDEYAELAGDVAGLAAGGATAEKGGDVARAAVSKLKLPVSGTPAQRAAVNWALERHAPLDAAAATQNPIVRGAQELSQSTLGSSTNAQRAIQARNDWFASQGRQLANDVHPTAATPETAGQAVYEAGVKSIRADHADANDAYAALRDREADPANVRNVQVGTKQEATGRLDHLGNPETQTVPVTADVPLPVDMRPYKAQFAPVLEDLNRRIRLGQSQYAPAQMAVEDLVKGADHVPASVAEDNLGALKEVARDNTLTGGVTNKAGALAKQSIDSLQTAIDGTVENYAGADALDDLRAGRQATYDKYQAMGLVDQFRSEPVKLYNQLTASHDGAIDMLRRVQAVAPDQMPQLGRAYLDAAIDKATESGGFDHSAKLFADWQKLGDGTKQILFGDKPGMISDLDNYFQAAKDAAKVENTSGTARVAHITSQGAMVLANPVAGGAYIIGGNVVSRLLYNPRFVRAAIRGFGTEAGSSGAGAVGAALAKAAGADAVKLPANVTAAAPAATPVESGTPAAGAVGSTAATGLPETPQTEGKLSNAGTEGTPVLAGGPREGQTDNGANRGGESASGAGQSAERSNTVIRIPGESGGRQASYKAVELADLQPSHSGHTFQPNPEYGPGKQDRNYGNGANQGKIVNWSLPSEFEPKYLISDNPDATNGPPVVDSDGNVLGGNGRVMILQRVHAGNAKGAAAYRDLLLQKAEQFGLDPKQIEGMKQPVLVRELADSELGDKAKLITDFNKKGTAELTPSERAVADSRRVSAATLDDLAGRLERKGEDATVADVLDGKSGSEILKQLIGDGVISPQEWAAFEDANGLTKAGRARIGALITGRFFADSSQMDSVSPSVLFKLERAAAPLSKAEPISDWNLTPDIQDAVSILEGQRAHGAKTLDDYLEQDGLFGKQKYSQQAVTLAHALKDLPAAQLTDALRQYASDAASADQGPSMFGDAPKPAESFLKAFEDAAGRAADKAAAKKAAAEKPAAGAKPDGGLSSIGKNQSPDALMPENAADPMAARRKAAVSENQTAFGFDAAREAEAGENWHHPTREQMRGSTLFEISRNKEKALSLKAEAAGLRKQLDATPRLEAMPPADGPARNVWLARAGRRAMLEDQYSRATDFAERLKARNAVLEKHAQFFDDPANDNAADIARSVRVGNSVESRRAAREIVAGLHLRFPDLAQDLAQRGIISQLHVGGEVFPSGWASDLKNAHGLAAPDGQIWMNENHADAAIPVEGPLWKEHSTSSYAATQADKTLATFVHEAGHRYHFTDRTLSWTWGSDTNKLTELYENAKKNDKLITKYAGVNEKEYFAESFAAALLHPEQLAKRDPAMYQLMKEFAAVKGIGELK